MAGALSATTFPAAARSAGVAAAGPLSSHRRADVAAAQERGVLGGGHHGRLFSMLDSSLSSPHTGLLTRHLSCGDGDGKLFFHGGQRLVADRAACTAAHVARSHRRAARAEASVSTPSVSDPYAPYAVAAGAAVGTKKAKISITMGDNMNDGMLGKARIVIVGDGKEVPDGPRAPARPEENASTSEDDGYDLGFALWRNGKTVSVTIDDLPKNVNPAVVLLYNDSSHGKWFVKKVEIETEAYTSDGGGDNGKTKKYVFPCFSFVPTGDNARIIFEGRSQLPWQTPQRLSNLYREGALDQQFAVYKFDEYNDLSKPADLADRGSPNFRPRLRPYPKRQATAVSGTSVGIPRDDNFDLSKITDFLTGAAKAQAQALLADPVQLASNRPWKTVNGLISGLFEGVGALRKPAILKHGLDWKSDKEFGRQTLAGLNPMEITLVKELPAGFVISDDDLTGALPAGLTLADAVSANRVFILDYSILEAIRPIVNRPPPAGKEWNRYLYAPRCLLFRDDNGDVIPMAIQLEAGGKVYTSAKDTGVGKWQWTLAKAYVASADSSVHQVARHFLQTHAVCEVYLIALRRRLSELHPLFKLLIPHFRFTLSINYRARTGLINAEGIIEDIFSGGSQSMAASAEVFKTWKFEDQALPNNLEKRGVADVNVLPYYPYRDVGTKIWDAMHKYVLTYLRIYYGETEASREFIVKDKELVAWWTDVKFGNSKFEYSFSEVEEWPKLETVEDLAFICTTIMWTASAQHAAVNFCQYDYYAFTPNHPAATRRPMPDKVDEKTFMEVMPLPRDQVTAISVVDLLSAFSDDEEYIGRKDQTAYGWLVDPAAKEAYEQFCNDLDYVEKEVQAYNELNKTKGRLPYKYLFPRTNRNDKDNSSVTPNGTEGIPNSVSI
ncbi:hypothetical protein CBR_g76811 [Chara braunii]|uniref:Lipoxygenase domain-containing protein n=1 Tax=Chara braunii TaxID=69332 RepID=A0A388JJY3_CHABU|nr:hypothetical protein CBR_g76811 [Chara braunii]|eukprot:GBG43227.1 hypothetical protein CBR_g76811 [Chara braunii]